MAACYSMAVAISGLGGCVSHSQWYPVHDTLGTAREETQVVGMMHQIQLERRADGSLVAISAETAACQSMIIVERRRLLARDRIEDEGAVLGWQIGLGVAAAGVAGFAVSQRETGEHGREVPASGAGVTAAVAIGLGGAIALLVTHLSASGNDTRTEHMEPLVEPLSAPSPCPDKAAVRRPDVQLAAVLSTASNTHTWRAIKTDGSGEATLWTGAELASALGACGALLVRVGPVTRGEDFDTRQASVVSAELVPDGAQHFDGPVDSDLNELLAACRAERGAEP